MDVEVTSKTVNCLPKIKNVLLKYANSARDSLHGPPKCSDVHYSMTKHENGTDRFSSSSHNHKKRDVSSISQENHNNRTCSSNNPGKVIDCPTTRPSLEHQKLPPPLPLGESHMVAGVPSNSLNPLVNFNHYYYEAMKSLGVHPFLPFVPSIPGESSPYSGYKFNNESVTAAALKSCFVPSVSSNRGMYPILTPPDQTANEYTTTLLHDSVIPCFVIGGEKRLCMPKILVSVLKDFSLGDINAVLDELQIYCSRCTPEQLALLKKLDVIPNSTPSCGLITKTDAERLVSALLDKHQPRVNFNNISSLTSSTPSTDNSSRAEAVTPSSHTSPSSSNNNLAKNNTADKQCKSASLEKDEGKSQKEGGNSIRIHHNCFGKCTGMYRPAMYTTYDAPCIECITCSGLFSPSKFVCHTHKARNSRTCHWGFDSNNWRSYLVLSDNTDDAQNREVLDNMKSKFQPLQVEPQASFFPSAAAAAACLANKSPSSLLGLPSPQQMQQQPKISTSSSLEEHLVSTHFLSFLLPSSPNHPSVIPLLSPNP